jgi:MFS family permease
VASGAGLLKNVAALDRDLRLFLLFGFIAILGFELLHLVLNLYLLELGRGEAYIGGFNGLVQLTAGLTCLSIGFLFSRVGGWKTTVVGTAGYFVTALVLCFLTNPLALLICAGFIGVTSAIMWVGQMPLLISWSSPALTTAAVTSLAGVHAASLMLGSLSGGYLPKVIGWLPYGMDTETTYRWTLVAGAFVSLASLLPLLAMNRRYRGREFDPGTEPVEQAGEASHPGSTRRDIVLYVTMALFLAIGIGAMEPFYNVLLDQRGFSTGQIGLVFAAGSLLAIGSSQAGPVLMRLVGASAAQTILRLMPLPFHLLLIAFPGGLLVAVAYATRRMSGSASWPLESGHIGSLLPRAVRSHAFGLREAFFAFGYAVAAAVSGWLISRTGSYTPAYLILSAGSIASIVVYVLVFGNRRSALTHAGVDPTVVEERIDPGIAEIRSQ